jgi:gamma-tubulin complex component 5
MAQTARVAALTDELIHSILKFDPNTNKKAYKHAKDIATKGLRAHQYARTNQFDVESSYKGLDEKFRVLNRDDLADALTKRVVEINQRQSKWNPEYLSLLLQLSDRPTENSDVEALELLRPPTPPEKLTWKQILEEDPYSDEEIWKDIDYGEDSSEDEVVEKKGKGKGKESPSTSVDDDNTYDPQAYIVPVDMTIIQDLEKAQFWKRVLSDEEEKIEITELQAVRETLFMLAGLQTSLYHTDTQNNSIRVNQKYFLNHAMQRTADHLLGQLADIGRELLRLRQWIKRPSSLPLIQTFESAVMSRLREYDRMLADLQHAYLVPKAPISVSLLELHDQLRTGSRPILRLARLVAEIEPQLLVNPFVHLETLFEQISLAQVTLEKDIFDYFSHVFFECLQTYLKPIRRWMESGELGMNDETFFVFENDASSEVSSLWHDRFVLRRGQENALRSPSFLHPAAQKIFNTGKSVVFLKELEILGTALNSLEPEPCLDSKSVCGTSAEMPLSPFLELFQTAFQKWIGSKYSFASAILRDHLFSQCGLMRILVDFKTLYLGADGSVFQDFADAVFERMDEGQRGWNDRFLLTELARGIFNPVLSRTHVEKVVVRTIRSKPQEGSVKGLGILFLDYAVSQFHAFLGL